MFTEDAFHDLEAALLDEPSDDPTSVPAVQDREHADRILRRIDRHRRQAAQVVEIARIETDRIAAWRDRELARIAAAELHEVGRATSYHRMEYAQDPDTLTIRLPNGSLVSRDQQPEWEFDPAAFVPWALEHLPAALNPPPPPPPPSIDKTAAKRLLTQEEKDEKGRLVRRVYGIAEGGAVPAGVVVIARGRKFDVTTETPRPREYERVVEWLAAQAALVEPDPADGEAAA